MENKKLTKGVDKIICGVCSGIAEYFNVDPTIIRIIYLILFFFYGVGIIPYFICALLMPNNNQKY